jgi:hypothetical protein
MKSVNSSGSIEFRNAVTEEGGGWQDQAGAGWQDHCVWFAEGLLAELDAEGEWYFDEATHKLFYHPAAGIVRFFPHSAHRVV